MGLARDQALFLDKNKNESSGENHGLVLLLCDWLSAGVICASLMNTAVVKKNNTNSIE